MSRSAERTQASELYLRIVEQMEVRRREIGLTFERLDANAGTQTGYASKAFKPLTPSGRLARFQTLDWLMGALYPEGYRIFVVPDAPKQIGVGTDNPIGRLFALLACAGVDGLRAAKLLADAALEFDSTGGLIIDGIRAAKRREYRRRRAVGKFVPSPPKVSQRLAPQRALDRPDARAMV
jgi:hypothetical protein